MLSKTMQESRFQSGKSAATRHKRQRSAAPTIAESIRLKEKRIERDYFESLQSCPMYLPKEIRFGTENDGIAEVRL